MVETNGELLTNYTTDIVEQVILDGNYVYILKKNSGNNATSRVIKMKSNL